MVVPVALAHAGWVALQLRQTLGNRIPKLVFLEWIILDAPPPFLLALKETQSPGQWKQTIDPMFSRWLLNDTTHSKERTCILFAFRMFKGSDP